MPTSSTSKSRSQQSQQQDSSKIYKDLKDHSDDNLKEFLDILYSTPDKINEYVWFLKFVNFIKVFEKNLKFDGKHFYDNLISDFDLNIFVRLENIYNEFIEKNGWKEDRNLNDKEEKKYNKLIQTQFKSHIVVQDNFATYYKNGDRLYQKNHMFFFLETKKNTLEAKVSLEFTVKYKYNAENKLFNIIISFFTATPKEDFKKGWQYFFCFLDNPFIHITPTQKEQTSPRIGTKKQKQQKPTGMHTRKQITDQQLVEKMKKFTIQEHSPQVKARQLVNDIRNFPNPDENSSFYLSSLFSSFHRYAMNIGFYNNDENERFSHGYGIYSDMKLQEFIYNLKEQTYKTITKKEPTLNMPLSVPIPQEKKVLAIVTSPPFKHKFFYEGCIFFIPDGVYGPPYRHGQRSLEINDYYWFLKKLQGKITWQTGQICSIDNGNFDGIFYFMDLIYDGRYREGIFEGDYSDSFGFYENVKKKVTDLEFSKVNILREKKSEQYDYSRFITKQNKSSPNTTTTRPRQQNQQKKITTSTPIKKDQQQKMITAPPIKQSQRQKIIKELNQLTSTPKGQNKSGKITTGKKNSNRFLTFQERNQQPKKKQSQKNIHSINELDLIKKDAIENYLSEENKIMTSTDLLIPQLNSFINNCSSNDTPSNRKILNNRRKLIFPILRHMNEDNIINNIFKQMKYKKYISVVDVTNFLIFQHPNRQQTNIFYISKFLENEKDLDDKMYIFVCQEQFNYLQEKLINLEIYENHIIINVACLSTLDTNTKKLIQIQDIDKQLKNNRKTDCFRERFFNKNPLDDFVIIIILDCIYELYQMKNSINSKEFNTIYPFHMYEIEILSYDRFTDWNIEKIISGYKIFGYLVKRIFDFGDFDGFHFLDYHKKRELVMLLNDSHN